MRVKYVLSSFLVTGAASLLMPAAAEAAVITVPNGSFENTGVGGDGYGGTGGTGFAWIPGGGTFVESVSTGIIPTPPDGSQVVGLNNNGNFTNIYQDIQDPAIGDPSVISYTLTAYFATRVGASGQEASDANINLGLADSTQNIGSQTSFLRSDLNSSSFTEFSVTLSAAGELPGDSLRPYLDKLNGGLIVADDFVITANTLPEPASLALLGIGSIGLLGRRRRHA